MELKGKKINFLGDSITEGVGVSCAEHRYPDLIAADCGCIVRNYGISGTRIARQAQQKSPHALILLRADPFEFLHVCAPLLSPISRD